MEIFTVYILLGIEEESSASGQFQGLSEAISSFLPVFRNIPEGRVGSPSLEEHPVVSASL